MHNPFTIPPDRESAIRAMLANATQEWHAVKRVDEILGDSCNELVRLHWWNYAKMVVRENVEKEREEWKKKRTASKYW